MTGSGRRRRPQAFQYKYIDWFSETKKYAWEGTAPKGGRRWAHYQTEPMRHQAFTFEKHLDWVDKIHERNLNNVCIPKNDLLVDEITHLTMS